ncbi:ABC transporter inner membrane protein [Bordetella bronchiseptica]|nr:ABC transporter inner membrane protein [Bordetella bronchiseptica]
MKPIDHRAWLLVLPVVLCVAFSAILPLMTIVNYSVQDIIAPDRRVFVGTEWFAAVLQDEELHGALWRQIGFSLAVLLIEIPLGILLALAMPTRCAGASRPSAPTTSRCRATARAGRRAAAWRARSTTRPEPSARAGACATIRA